MRVLTNGKIREGLRKATDAQLLDISIRAAQQLARSQAVSLAIDLEAETAKWIDMAAVVAGILDKKADEI